MQYKLIALFLFVYEIINIKVLDSNLQGCPWLSFGSFIRRLAINKFIISIPPTQIFKYYQCSNTSRSFSSLIVIFKFGKSVYKLCPSVLKIVRNRDKCAYCLQINNAIVILTAYIGRLEWAEKDIANMQQFFVYFLN